MCFVWLCSLDEHWAVNQGKIYLSAVSIRFINRVTGNRDSGNFGNLKIK